MIGLMEGASERAAVLVIRAWLEEENGEKPFRARITFTLDASAPDASTTTGAATEREVVAVVSAWLRLFVAGR